MFRQIGAPEIILILVVLVLLFGAKKLPELARGSGRALRIFKAETKGLMDDEDDKGKTEEQRQIDAQRRTEAAQRVESQRVDGVDRVDAPAPVEPPRADTDR